MKSSEGEAGPFRSLDAMTKHLMQPAGGSHYPTGVDELVGDHARRDQR
jgi:hypothetical protein